MSATPSGFQTVERPRLTIVARTEILADVEAALTTGTLYEYARARPDVQAFRGRGNAYAFSAPTSGLMILVRRSRHGGLLAPITGDIFVSPGRAGYELSISMTLADRGVCTAEVLGYVRYHLVPGYCRTDVVTRFIPRARDMATLLRDENDPALRMAAVEATARLLQSLSNARARHPDINLRNVLVTSDADSATASVIDVDRVLIDSAPPSHIARANFKRFLRSASKLQTLEKKLMLRPNEMILLASSLEAPQ